MPKGTASYCACGCGVTPTNYRKKFFDTWNTGYPFQGCGMYYCANYGSLDKNGNLCTFVSVKCPKAHVDHIVAKSFGGPNCINNLRIMCAHCNESKGAEVGELEKHLAGLGLDNCRVAHKKKIVKRKAKKYP